MALISRGPGPPLWAPFGIITILLVLVMAGTVAPEKNKYCKY